jgi:hypothetical protein
MKKKTGRGAQWFFWSLIAFSFLRMAAMANAQPRAALEQKTLEAFDAYVEEFERDVNDALSGKKPFLWIRRQSSDEEKRARRGEILIFKHNENIDVPKGIIHVWGVSGFLPGTSVDDVIALLLDYNRHKDVYPTVIDSKLLQKSGGTVKGYLRFKYKKGLTAVLNTEHQAELVGLDRGRYFIRVHSTRIAEVADYGKPDEHELPPGRDSGFMWRLNTYWFLEPQSDGVFIECQSLTLSRSLPFGLGWLIKPFVQSIPRDSLKELMEGTRKALNR